MATTAQEPTLNPDAQVDTAGATIDQLANDQDQNAEDTAAEPIEAEPTSEPDPLAKAQAELVEWKDKYLRLYSEYDNFRRRTQREKADLILNAGENVILKLIPTLDDFERAQKAMATATDLEALRDGMSLVHNKLRVTLEQMGLKPMNAGGTAFNPDLHEAITQIQSPTPEQKGTVLDEVEKGYLLNDKTIRFAKVVIGS